MAEQGTTQLDQGVLVRPGRADLATRFQPGVCPNPNGRRGNRLPGPALPTAQDLAGPHLRRAIERLAELMELDGRNAGVARAAASDLIKLACPDATEEAVAKLVTEKLQAMIAEAEAARAAREAKVDP